MVQSRVQTNPVSHHRYYPFLRMRMWALARWRRRGKRLLKSHLSSVGHLYLEERLLCCVLSSRQLKKRYLALKLLPLTVSSRRNMATTGSKPPPQESLPYTLSLSLFRSWLFPESYKGRSNQAGRIEGMEKGKGGGQEDWGHGPQKAKIFGAASWEQDASCNSAW